VIGLEQAAFSLNADVGDFRIEHDPRLGEVDDLGRSRAGLQHGVNNVAGFIVEVSQLAIRQDDVRFLRELWRSLAESNRSLHRERVAS
jgi:hypothetical protein